MIIMYKSIGADSKLLFRDLILIPKPAVAPVDSAAISVVSATEAPSLTAVRINGNVAGAITLMKISLSVAPRTLAALSFFRKTEPFFGYFPHTLNKSSLTPHQTDDITHFDHNQNLV